MLPLIGALVLASLGASAALTLAARTLGRRLLLLDSPGAPGHAKVLRGVPNTGGIAIFWTVALPIALGLALARLVPDAALPDALRPHAPGLREQTPMALCVLLSMLLLHLTGLIDDRRPLGPLIKLGVMVLAAAAPAVLFDVRLLELLDARVGGPWLSIALTVAWIVLVTNAMNFMDNMDGLAAGVGLVASGLFLAAALVNGQWFVAMTLALLTGALGGFLVFNAPRRGGATIFMGDAGSLVVGYLLAILTVRTTYYQTGSGGWYALFMPLSVLAVPMYDLVTVSVIRIASGRSPLVGDQRHFSHRLRARGLSTGATLVIIAGLAGVTGIGGVLLGQVGPWQAALIGLQTVLALLVLALFEFAPGSRP
ncbi:MAG TPA: undecaprenyl/decaprenyl-phosphate alpha-N-acetylglucosaminyl 1-phosphate transferase [Phycisphaerales bacterium]|nr:undecaprenyl/decaprenyl-phosphate alpha-N-acetylglucosaminyl 1-phosphate transferase [Phycisphaerales bacterium]